MLRPKKNPLKNGVETGENAVCSKPDVKENGIMSNKKPQMRRFPGFENICAAVAMA